MLDALSMPARFLILISALLVACSSPDRRPDDQTTTGSEPEAAAAIKVLAAGSILRLTPCEIVREAETGDDVEASVIDGLLREALRQSTRFDIAAGLEDCESPMRIEVAVDPIAKQLTTSLRMGLEQGPYEAAIPLVSSSYRDQRLDQAIDSLALGLRRALGEVVRGKAMPSGKIYSKSLSCVRKTEAAFKKIAKNDRRSAISLWKSARRDDPGCTLTLTELARADMQEDRSKKAATDVQKTLKHLEARISPTTQHRLARIYYMARAGGSSARGARNWDQRLLELGLTGLGERPYDKHALYTKAIALNYLGRFEDSAPLLRQLAVRWPRQEWVAYHLAFANLALKDYEAALEIIESSSRRLGGASTFMPRALALYHCGKQKELRQQFERLAESPAIKSKETAEHSLLRMRASHEILTGHRAAAAKFLLDDIDWLRKRPSLCDSFALDLFDAGEVLIRLGYHRELGTRIGPLTELGIVSPTFSQALTYLGARVLVSETDKMPAESIRALEKQQQHVWSHMLKAAVHRRRGELLAETRELGAAIQRTDNALVRASLARALDTMGKTAQAKELLSDLQQRLLAIDLRRSLKHPLVDPAHAMAYLAARSAAKE